MVEERDLPPRAVEATAKTRDKRDKFDNFMPIRRTQSAPTVVDAEGVSKEEELASVLAEAGDTFGNVMEIRRTRSTPTVEDTKEISIKEFDSAITKAIDEFGNASLDFLFSNLSAIKFKSDLTYKGIPLNSILVCSFCSC